VASSSNLLPISLLLAKIVCSGLVTAYYYLLIKSTNKLWLPINEIRHHGLAVSSTILKWFRTYLSLGGDSDESLAVVREGDGGGRGSLAWKKGGERRKKRKSDDLPSAFSMTLALLPSMTATQELVVPRSIPMILNKQVRKSNKGELLLTRRSFFASGRGPATWCSAS